MHATCPINLFLFDLITITISGEEEKLLSSLLSSFCYLTVRTSFVDPNTILYYQSETDTLLPQSPPLNQ